MQHPTQFTKSECNLQTNKKLYAADETWNTTLFGRIQNVVNKIATKQHAKDGMKKKKEKNIQTENEKSRICELFDV